MNSLQDIELSPVIISRWKKEFLENSSAAFETPKMDDAAGFSFGFNQRRSTESEQVLFLYSLA